MRPRRGSVQIDRGGRESGGFGALRAPATMGAYEENSLSALLIYGYELLRNTFRWANLVLHGKLVSDLGSIPIARSISLDDSITLTRLSY